MPPFIPKKRRRSTTPPGVPTLKPAKTNNASRVRARTRPKCTLQQNKEFLDALEGSGDGSSLSDADSDEFEDAFPVPEAKRHKAGSEAEDEDEMDWENVIAPGYLATAPLPSAGPSKSLELTLDKSASKGSLTNPYEKKNGPSKIERQIRTATHRIHVQCLMYHNAIRNGWACDAETQHTLVDQLPSTVKREVNKWRTASGLAPPESGQEQQQEERKAGRASRKAKNKRSGRDWGGPAKRQEINAPHLSRGDPLIRLLRVLSAYWKKRFVITAPGLRKQGYKPLPVLEEELASWKKGERNVEAHGERIERLAIFRQLAKTCEGSKDVGNQLFAALVRGIGVEARLVASLQPLGYGWNKGEDASLKASYFDKQSATDAISYKMSSTSEIKDEQKSTFAEPREPNAQGKQQASGKRRALRGAKSAPIDLEAAASTDERGDVQTDEDDDDHSVVDVTPRTPRMRPNANYDRDMPAPTYWTEAISPVSNEIIPVAPFLIAPVASNAQLLANFESRGTKADKARQVFAYVIAYSSDGSAKEVTTRYLKRHMWPGRTRGVRMPVEKVPVHNRKGKIKRYEEYDWFKRVLSGYEKHHALRTVVDDIEEVTDLRPAEHPRREVKEGEETLQGYKTSADFVLSRHLRREEALRPDAKPIKTFQTGKGDQVKEEPVFLRKDVEICRTAESWHKEGRAIKAGVQAMKSVPVRAVTANKKREVEEAERDGGGKLMQGMYAREQTDWIIPDPIENGVIPKNVYGNIDCFVPSMVPKGAIHVPLRGTAKVCKRLGIDFAEAVTGFEFGHRMAIPVLTGVVVARENEDAVIDAWQEDEKERQIKEEGKREKQALGMWRKWILSLRVLHRVREEYGDHTGSGIKEEINPFVNKSKAKARPQLDDPATPILANSPSNGHVVPDQRSAEDASLVGGGGFLLNDEEEENQPRERSELTVETGNHLGNIGQGFPDNSRELEDEKKSPSPKPAEPIGTSKLLLDSENKPKATKDSQAKNPPAQASRTRKSAAPANLKEAPSGTANGSVTRSGRCQSAQRAAAAIKSPYFEHSGGEEDHVDESGEASSASHDSDVQYLPKTKPARASYKRAKKRRPKKIK